MPHLFLFSLSPVQAFIAQARKTRDLYAGSRILSEMTQAAARQAVAQHIALIFPAEVSEEPAEESKQGPSFPNRFLGKIEGNFSPSDLQQKGEAIEEAALRKFKDFAEDAWEKAGNAKIEGAFWKQIYQQWDLNWLFYPYSDEQDYSSVYLKAQAALEALKNQRIITNDLQEAGRKCSLDGQLNALFRGRQTTNGALKRQAVEVVHTWFNPNEGLSAVSFVKRAYTEKHKEVRNFASTVEVALKQQLAKVEAEKPGLLECYRKLFSQKSFEACLELLSSQYLLSITLDHDEGKKEKWLTSFNEEFYVEDNLTADNIPNPKQREIAQTIHRQHLKNALTDRYYALMAFDVDHLGKLLSGARWKGDEAGLQDFQRKLSQNLMTFSQWIDKWNNKHLPKKKIDLVYAGGDDYMGFVNLDDLFEVGEKLRRKFHKKVSKAMQADLADEQPITFSMGITIAHYKTPLSIVLDTTRKMVKMAKNEHQGNRNAFAISVLKHSGEDHHAYFKWGDENLPAWNALKNLVDYLQNHCSETFIRAFIREFSSLQNEEGEMEVPQKAGGQQESNIIKTELLRLAQRSLQEGKKSMAEALTNESYRLFSVKTKKLKADKVVDVANALEALKIVLFVKRKSTALKEET